MLAIRSTGKIRYYIIILVLCSFFLCPFHPSAYTRQATSPSGLKFSRISVDQGLSQSSVFSICQDKKGFLWFGTLEGLNKYDGYNFTVFRANQPAENSLSSSTIFKLYEDRQGTLWIGTLGGGLTRYNKDKENFTSYLNNPADPASLSNNNVRAIFEASDGKLWVGTNNGLNILDRKTGRFEHFFNNAQDLKSLSNNYVWSIYEDSRRQIWIGTYGGLNRYDPKTRGFIRYTYQEGQKNGLSNNYVWDILEDSKHRLWLGTNNGLNLFDRNTNRFTVFKKNPADPSSISQNNIWRIFQDSKGLIWVGTLGGGLNRIVENSRGQISFVKYQYSAYDPKSISHNYVWSIFEDRSGVLWIGTDLGLNMYDSKKEKFRLYQNNPFIQNSLSNNEVTAFCSKSSNKSSLGLWIGTRNGLNFYDPVKNSYRQYKTVPGKENSLSTNYIRSLYEDKHGVLWIGTSGGGVDEFEARTGTFKHHKVLPGLNSITDNNVTAIHEDREGTIWVGTLSGLNKFNRQENKFIHYLNDPKNPSSISHNYVYSIYEDEKGRLWIGTLGGGLNCFDKNTGSFKRFQFERGKANVLSNNYVWTIMEDHIDGRDVLWIGTNDGLNKMDLGNNSVTVYKEKDGLPNSVIYGILKDNKNDLWLSTNKGISKFDLKRKTFRNYSPGDGLQSYQFNGGAFFKSKQGEMFFGGINGFNSFYPDSVEDNRVVPPIVITNFLISNKPVKAGEDSPLSKSITETSEIRLNYSQSVFSFEFAALHYSNPTENQYAYKLEGFDKNWNFAKTRRFVTYTNLDPGMYTFRVIGSNSDGVWNTRGASLRIIISPPYWRTWWFIFICCLVVFGLIWLVFAVRMRHLLDIERLRLKISADLHDDIGTRLTEISMLSDIAIGMNDKDGVAEIKETVKKVGSIARNLIDNMSDIIWLINPKKDSLSELFLKLRDSYEEIFSYSQILLHINNAEFLEEIKLPIEYRKHLYLIFKEALNNSLKYSKCTEISINTQVNGRILDITLYDNGTGFDMNKPSSGNGLGNMKSRAEQIKGTLRIQSKPGEGTMIKFVGYY
ncbi:MAG: GGDEF domain-containing protein [Ignavibacteria bacterium]|jgi:ligand-binding sensor domain-containing protein/two-component sensor histidine kinase|nr:GGDEF domain-containing protein [Ignavibacteria bacterium]MCU7504704.1 GGDEF domain-containing protein [Ignavibacteria bacterium]MCU7516306.1 GGDEF domain-containing protein [Ignavibacteria bacterium]